ncbi:DoxX family protein [Sphaerisporangium dianthi]|uniref:DoxX family protein n=1 Tax=Sphaerisporangium dianthi TaxID=1436120 RepID=A0ABV9CJJ0_9ACTN
MNIAVIILSFLLALTFAFSGVSKLAGAATMRQSAEHLGIDFSKYRLIGVPEVAGAAGLIAGLWVVPLGIAAAVGLALLMVGAVVVHIRAHDGADKTAPAGVLALLSLVLAVLLPLAV